MAQWPAEVKKILNEKERKRQIQRGKSAGNRLIGMMSGRYSGFQELVLIQAGYEQTETHHTFLKSYSISHHTGTSSQPITPKNNL